MKRLHVHVAVKNLEESVRFYRGLFAAEPTVHKDDYAKWMLDDPLVNFAISTRSETTGLSHLGIQVDSNAELTELAQRAISAGLVTMPEEGANCCYAQSDKQWVADPQGILWEAFHTVGEIPTYSGQTEMKSGCCNPTEQSASRPQRCC
ncbi:ArsI/CadI family heavy metal resistance metalloenzyme [Chitinimonas lacunae]|uniref:ArsI/CadI family heavy metal resistance metalloenzyme n=1 Tax=Chitinimonas lacunae TaxID=1963018 RepID=A0ABV8MQ38_9NEIS